MTFAHPSGPARPATARIRILGCDPPPPRRRGPNWTLVGAGIAVAAAGVGMTVFVRGTHPQNPPSPSAVVALPVRIDVMAHADLGARRPDPRAMRVFSAVTADFPAAARRAAQREAPVVTTVATGTAGEQTRVTVSPPRTGESTQPSTGRTSSAPASAVGPELPPNPAAPNSPLDPQ